MTNSQLIERFISNLLRNDKSEHTVRSFKSTLESLSQLTTFTSTTMFDIEDFIDSLKAKGNSPTTINQRISAIQAFFKYIHKANIIQVDPSIGIEYVKLETKETHFELLDLSTYEAIYADKKIDHAIRLAILVSAMGGLRTSEICNLMVEDIDFIANTITVNQGKGNKTRVVAVSSKLTDMIKDYMLTNKVEHGNLILNKQHKPMTENNLQVRFANLKKKKGIDERIHLHSGRHFCATFQVSNGIPMYMVAKQLGHSSVSTTEQFYLKQDIKKASELVNQIW